MDLSEACRVVRDASARWGDGLRGYRSPGFFPGDIIPGLLACLCHRGLPAEMAACALDVWTKRPRQDDSPLSLVVSHDNWEAYLRSHGMLRVLRMHATEFRRRYSEPRRRRTERHRGSLSSLTFALLASPPLSPFSKARLTGFAFGDQPLDESARFPTVNPYWRYPDKTSM